jgi:hypothetical protein
MSVSSSGLRRSSIVLLGASLVAACGTPVQRFPATDAGAQVSLLDAGSMSPAEAGAQAVAQRGCDQCHSSSVGTFAGNSVPVSGTQAYAPNITPDLDTGVGSWTDEHLMRAIRFGVDDEGATLCSQMPRATDMSDTEAADIVAYLRSLPPVKNQVPESSCTASTADVALHGQLVAAEQSCATCHGKDLSGSDTVVPGTQAYGPNITPDADTGIGSWTHAQRITAIKTGLDDEGATLCAAMPRFDTLSDDELDALATYLEGVTAVAHASPESTCPETSTAAIEGAKAAAARGCDSCHGATYVGNGYGLNSTMVYPPNLTPDMNTGLGGWSDKQVIDAMRLGVDDEGATLCSVMPRYPTMSDTEAANIVAFLRSLAPVVSEVPETVCPDTGNDDGGTTLGTDAGVIDAGTIDAGTHDAGTPDAGGFDAGTGGTCTGSVVISEIYGAGGNAGALYNSDFVELHNRGTTPVAVGGWAIQYASTSGSAWGNQLGTLPAGTTIAAGGYLLVATGAAGTTGATLSGAVGLSKNIDLASANGKVALTSNATALTGACPTGGAIVDFVGYGTANCSEGMTAAPALSASLAAFRGDMTGTNAACADTANNAHDFSTGAPMPHASANTCVCP